MNGINYWNLIKKKTVDNMCPFGNKKNNYINHGFPKVKQTGKRSQREETQTAVGRVNSYHSMIEPCTRPSELKKQKPKINNGKLPWEN